MKPKPLLDQENAVAIRQPKTDRLILARFLRDAGADKRLDVEPIDQAHKVLLKWADLETTGRLKSRRETQLQGEFLSDVFGEALGYRLVTDTQETWHLEREVTIAGQTPDAVLGFFRQDEPRNLLAVIELKGPNVHLDRDRSHGRTAIDQCWDYLVNTPPACRWGIVSNMVSFRLYQRDSSKRAYEHFTLQSLRDSVVFRQFYALFHRKGLIEETAGQAPRAIGLLEKSSTIQREVGDRLYKEYSEHRLHFIGHLHHDLGHTVDESIEFAQRLLDRVVFIAFCEDRGLLPPGTIKSAYEELPAFTAITNPRWQNFKTLFRFVDQGSPLDPNSPNDRIPAYNGGLFKASAADDLELDDRWTRFFNNIAGYDFADEVNLDVLGHLFERSITELEKLKTTGLFGDAEKAEKYAQMPQSAKRKQLGIYYTPPELTSLIVEYTVDELIAERFADLAIEFGIERADAKRGIAPEDADYWQQCLTILRDLRIVDPACGSGAFLFQAYNTLEQRYLEVVGHLQQAGTGNAEQLTEKVPQWILEDNLYGVDLSPEAVEITQLALWIRSATPGQTLATLSENIVHGNSLVHDAEVDSAGFDWRQRFAEVFEREAHGFDCVVGNPPWERIKLQEREFFSVPAPEIATATNAAKRRKLVAKLESDDPALYGRYEQALEAANALLTYCRKSNDYPLAGKGDINTYAVFAELAYQLVAPDGRVGLLTPSGIASDKTTKDFFAAIAESNRLIRLYDFKNKKIHFPDVHASFKFCILNFGGEATTTDEADFAFFIHHVEELEDKKRHISLSSDDIRLLNPNTHTCPIFRTRRDAEITKAIYRRVPILIDRNRKGPTGNSWGIKFGILFHQAKDAPYFTTAEELTDQGFKCQRNIWKKCQELYLPCFEAKMAQPYNHRAAGVRFEANWTRQGQPTQTSLVNLQNPEYLPLPRWWAPRDAVVDSISKRESICLFSFRKVTSPTNTRTLLTAFLPIYGAIDSLQFAFFEDTSPVGQCCLMANFNAFVLDFVLRQKMGNVNASYYLVEQLPFLAPDTYAKPCPWAGDTTLETWISERVLKLTCTAEDMLPLAEACEFTLGSFQKEYGGRLNKWDEAERAQLMAELDAAYFHLYGLSRDDAEYILSTFKGIHNSNSLLPDGMSTAEHILRTYDALAATQ